MDCHEADLLLIVCVHVNHFIISIHFVYISKVGTMGTISYPGENLRTRGFFSEIHSLLTRIRIFSEIHALLRPEIHALLTRIRIFKRNSHTFDENRTI